jgi:DNA replication protein DnaC
MISSPCRQCGSPVEFDPALAAGDQRFGVTCAECIAKEEAEQSERARNIKLMADWHKLCPPLFQNTELEKLPCPDKTRAALAWRFYDGQGLNLWGFPNSGKTRTLFLIVNRLHFSGRRCKVFSPADFMQELEARNYHRAEWIRQLAKVDVVGFDDMDKLALTRPQEKIFFALLDKRMTTKRPCLFTHNSTAEELEYNFKTGAALVRRIRQFTRSIHFP